MQFALSVPGRLTPVSMELPPRMDYEDWAAVGVKLTQIHEFSNWAIGDWLCYGENHFGETYSQAASETGIGEDRLMILRHVSLRVDPLNRIPDLSWSHHRVTAKLPPDEQRQWLLEASKQNWSVKELIDGLRKKGRREPSRQKENEEEETCPVCTERTATVKVCSRCLAAIKGKVAEVAA
jgi:hypothetical protein